MRHRVFHSMFVLVVLAASAGCAPSAKTDPVSPQPISTPESSPSKPTPTPAPDKAEEKKVLSPAAQPKPSKGPSLDEMLLFFPTKYPDGDWKPKGLDFEDAW